jgi:hypothetical protein
MPATNVAAAVAAILTPHVRARAIRAQARWLGVAGESAFMMKFVPS